MMPGDEQEISRRTTARSNGAAPRRRAMAPNGWSGPIAQSDLQALDQ
jgi:hypothetical protein